jgi:hypothetical protein
MARKERPAVNEEMAAEEASVYRENVRDVQADNVSIFQGGARDVQAETVTVRIGGLRDVQAGEVVVRQGGIGRVESEKATVTQGGVGLVRAGEVSLMASQVGAVISEKANLDQGSAKFLLARGDVEMDQAGTVVMLAGKVRASNCGSIFLVAKEVEGEITTQFGPLESLVFGAAAGLVAGLMILLSRGVKKKVKR